MDYENAFTASEKEYSFYIDTSKKTENLTIDDILNCWPSNRDRFDKLVKIASSGCLIPFIGAGLTQKLAASKTFPQWKELILKIATDKRVGTIGKAERDIINELILSKDYMQAAQVLENIYGNDVIQDCLREYYTSEFDDNAIRESPLMYLPQLHLPIILTTNYDTAIEYSYSIYEKDSILKDRIGVSRSILSQENFIKVLTPSAYRKEFVNFFRNRELIGNTLIPVLYKFHGDVGDTSGVHDLILTERAYNEAYGKKGQIKKGKETELVQNLSMCLLTKTILFLGCSLEQDRIMDLIKRHTEGIIHYAFLPCGEKSRENFDFKTATAEALKKSSELLEMGIYPIFYPRYAREGGKNCICTFLEAIAKLNTSVDSASIYEQKYKWLEEYLNKLELNGIKRHIIFFGGIFTDLRTPGKSNIENLKKWLKTHPEGNIYFCYEDDEAIIRRGEQIENGASKENPEGKNAEILSIPLCFSEESRSRVHIIPITYALTGYAVLADNELYWNIITEQRSSTMPVIRLTLEDGRNTKFIRYMKYALDRTSAYFEQRKEENLIHLDNINSLDTLLSNYL